MALLISMCAIDSKRCCEAHGSAEGGTWARGLSFHHNPQVSEVDR